MPPQEERYIRKYCYECGHVSNADLADRCYNCQAEYGTQALVPITEHASNMLKIITRVEKRAATGVIEDAIDMYFGCYGYSTGKDVT